MLDQARSFGSRPAIVKTPWKGLDSGGLKEGGSTSTFPGPIG